MDKEVAYLLVTMHLRMVDHGIAMAMDERNILGQAAKICLDEGLMTAHVAWDYGLIDGQDPCHADCKTCNALWDSAIKG